MSKAQINALDPLKLDLQLDASGFLPDPPTGTGLPFVVFRQPQKLESSRVELPEGYLVDLRYSGPTMSGASAAMGTPNASRVLSVQGRRASGRALT